MDTDDLSNETYKAVIITAEKFNHDLTLQFGCLAMECADDNEYLLEAEQFINGCLKTDNMDILMDYIFFGNPPLKKDFINTLSKIKNNINKVREIPIEKRTFEF